jgi:hypothetical protein
VRPKIRINRLIKPKLKLYPKIKRKRCMVVVVAAVGEM